MAVTIAISGKGGSGKTTVAAMLVRLLVERSAGSVLAVDADPNACLGQLLGVEPEPTVAELREKGTAGSGGSGRMRDFEYGLQQVVAEAKGFDLLTMGRPEGPGCYCAVNNMLRMFLDKLSGSYRYVVLDSEAGMEHLSRRTTNAVDELVIVAEPTVVGTKTAERIYALTKSLPISVKQIGVLWNKADSPGRVDGPADYGCLPYDEKVLKASMNGTTVFDLPPDSGTLATVRELMDKHLKT